MSLGGFDQGDQFTKDPRDISTVDFVDDEEVVVVRIVLRILAEVVERALLEVEALRALTYRACDLYVNGQDVLELASMAKLKAGRLNREVPDTCLQFWGGMGFTWDNANVLNEVTAVRNVRGKYANALACGSIDPAEALPAFLEELGKNMQEWGVKPEIEAFDPGMIAKLLPVLSQLNRPESGETAAFLRALRPFLKPERQDKVERAAQLARFIHLGKTLLLSEGGPRNV